MIKNCSKCKRIVNQKSVNAQGHIFHPECFICVECKKKINNSFNSKGTDFYHTECYQKKFRMNCSKCRKPLEEKYVISNGLKYHQTCYENSIQLKCDICKKAIESEYTHNEEGNYHLECYKAEKAPRCNICQSILEGEYFIDAWDNKFHKTHNGLESSYCDCCGRVLSDLTSKGFTKYPDGRKVCGICQTTEIIEIHQTVPSKIKVIEILNRVGFDYIPELINISLDNKININKLLGTSITNNTHGYTKTVIKNENGKIKKEYSIAMLYGLPKIQFEGVLAHELMHAWLHEKNIDMPDDMTEGFCNLACALIYQKDKTKMSEILLKQLDKDPDKVYGDGYRSMKEKLKLRGWNNLINDVINYKAQLIKVKEDIPLQTKGQVNLKEEVKVNYKEPPSNPYLAWKLKQEEKNKKK